jgi:hypothetical protein
LIFSRSGGPAISSKNFSKPAGEIITNILADAVPV